MLRKILILVLDEITQKYIRYLFLISVGTVSIILQFAGHLSFKSFFEIKSGKGWVVAQAAF